MNEDAKKEDFVKNMLDHDETIKTMLDHDETIKTISYNYIRAMDKAFSKGYYSTDPSTSQEEETKKMEPSENIFQEMKPISKYEKKLKNIQSPTIVESPITYSTEEYEEECQDNDNLPDDAANGNPISIKFTIDKLPEIEPASPFGEIVRKTPIEKKQSYPSRPSRVVDDRVVESKLIFNERITEKLSAKEIEEYKSIKDNINIHIKEDFSTNIAVVFYDKHDYKNNKINYLYMEGKPLTVLPYSRSKEGFLLECAAAHPLCSINFTLAITVSGCGHAEIFIPMPEKIITNYMIKRDFQKLEQLKLKYPKENYSISFIQTYI